ATFLPVLHSVLAGMFGKRPLPQVDLQFTHTTFKLTREKGIILELGVGVRNKGAVYLRDTYLIIDIEDFPDGEEGVSTKTLHSSNWRRDHIVL
ncbi:unnamed protein product, partial [marine sediment metagenome]